MHSNSTYMLLFALITAGCFASNPCPTENSKTNHYTIAASGQPTLTVPQELYTAIAQAQSKGTTSSTDIALACFLTFQPNFAQIPATNVTSSSEDKPPLHKALSLNDACRYSNFSSSYND